MSGSSAGSAPWWPCGSALLVVSIRGVLVLVVVALFLAVGLNPAVEFLSGAA